MTTPSPPSGSMIDTATNPAPDAGPELDVVVVGAGLMGAATAWAASQRGASVVVLEQFGAGHDRGSSHGSARIVRRAYGDALYVGLTGRAFELWRELEHATGATILRTTGGLDFGPQRPPGQVASFLREHGVPHAVLSAADAGARWPGMRFEGEVVFHEQAGTMDAAGAVEAFLAAARTAGATVRHGTAVRSIEPGDGRAAVRLADGTTLSARQVVVAAGGWAQSLLAGLVELPPLRVTQQQIFHFPRLDPSAPPWPSVIHELASPVYHLAGGRDGGPADDRKIGEHEGGPQVDASTRDGVVSDASRARVIEYVQRWLPGLDPTPRGEATCLYTNTPTEDFLIDRAGPLVVCSACSGHGAKFAPLIGEMCADLALGGGWNDDLPERFRLATHALGRVGSVSL